MSGLVQSLTLNYRSYTDCRSHQFEGDLTWPDLGHGPFPHDLPGVFVSRQGGSVHALPLNQEPPGTAASFGCLHQDEAIWGTSVTRYDWHLPCRIQAKIPERGLCGCLVECI